MKTQSMLLAAMASVPAVLAHTVFTDFYVDGVPQGDGVAMRMNPNAETAGSPIASLDSDDMACNVGGTKGVSRTQPVNDGALLTFEIREWADDASMGSIDRGHYGPCAVYLKKVSSAVDDKAAGDGWFKIFDHGYDASTKRWCTDEIIDNKGLFNVKLPKGLEGGDYLARPEILALHSANIGDPQPYTGCAQIFLKSSGSLGPESTVSIPGHMKAGEPSTSWDIYNQGNSKYPIPGPAVAKLVAKANIASVNQASGSKPADCIMENANWCGKEVQSYSDEKGCWAASEECWAQSKTCWSSTPPTGGSGCKQWETKCTSIQDACNAKDFNGPPNKGKVMTAEKKAIDVGKVMATVGGGIVDAPAPAPEPEKAPESKTQAQVPAKETPVAEKPDYPAQPPAKETPAAEKPAAQPQPQPQAPKPTPAAPKPDQQDSYPVKPAPAPAPAPEKEDKPAPAPAPAPEKPADKPSSTITAAPSAPKPTKGPACVPGGVCITVTEVEVVTQTVYVTAAVDFKRGIQSFRSRRRWAAHRA
ncbi:hypothetical protein HBH72_123810 [Parastagonospora nodorum]|nr:hypothetical protein HBH72_123810 [Parastagonospora nodorum]